MKSLVSVVVAVASLTGAGVVGASPPPLSPPSPRPTNPIAEGRYEGVLSWPLGRYLYSSELTDLASSWTLSNGELDLQVVGTTVTGSWSFRLDISGSGSSGSSTGAATAGIDAVGTFEGNANQVCMSGEMRIVGSMRIEDASGAIDIPLDETFPLDCSKLAWTVASASCTAASGEWTVPVADEITLTGAQFPTNGTFSVWRVGDAVSPADENAEVDQLLVEMERIINSEPFDGSALGAVLRRIAAFEGNAARNVECGQRDPQNHRITGSFLYRLIIDRMLYETSPVDLRTLRWLAYAALNTGLIGSASTQPDRAAMLETMFQERLLDMIDESVAARDQFQLARIELLAGQYGWEQLEAVAGEAYERVAGGS